MKVIISNTSDRPLYQQIEKQLKNAILREELKQGDLLPSIRSFANELKVSVLTIRRVYTELEDEGFVTSQVGIGTFVSVKNLDTFKASRRRLVEEKMRETIRLARTIQLSKEELTEMIKNLYTEE